MVFLLDFVLVFTCDRTRFCFDSTSAVNNLICSIDDCDIFVDYVGSGQLFVNFSFVSKNVFIFLELDVHVCSPNVFSQFSHPYNSLGLDSMASFQVYILKMMFLFILLHLVLFLVHVILLCVLLLLLHLVLLFPILVMPWFLNLKLERGQSLILLIGIMF